MKATVDRDTCAGHAVCESVCPSVFKIVDGKAQVVVNEVPEEKESLCREAAQSCPTQAIKIEE